jgi:hypothetical protein
MASEIEALKAPLAALEQDKEELPRKAKPRYNFQPTSLITASTLSPAVISSFKQQQTIQHQQIVALQHENGTNDAGGETRDAEAYQGPGRAASTHGGRSCIPSVSFKEYTNNIEQDVTLFNTKGNWTQ